jgi:hypothetical protein
MLHYQLWLQAGLSQQLTVTEKPKLFLLHLSCSTAQMEDQIRKMILNKTKQLSDKLTQDTGITPSIEEQDIKEYVIIAIAELKRSKTRK